MQKKGKFIRIKKGVSGKDGGWEGNSWSYVYFFFDCWRLQVQLFCKCAVPFIDGAESNLRILSLIPNLSKNLISVL